jgi:hypothetical protein
MEEWAPLVREGASYPPKKVVAGISVESWEGQTTVPMVLWLCGFSAWMVLQDRGKTVVFAKTRGDFGLSEMRPLQSDKS